ncbi:MAG: hypothetical protein ABSG95_01325 [Solirubrobacteraceae bacterium]|jgi:hypothetical protein
MPNGFNELDLLALSELAWDIVDPEGDHEAQEHIWTVALAEDRPAIATTQELRARLNEIADAGSWPPPAVHPRALVALMVFLAENPQRRRIEEAVLADALHDAFPDGLPPDMEAWLAERRQTPAAHTRTHGASQPRRHSDTRPPLPEDTSTA